VDGGRAAISLGIETEGGLMQVLIREGVQLPATNKLVFSTADDDQRSAWVMVWQGYRPITAYNEHLVTIEVSGIRPAPRGVPRIEVTLEVDPQGIVAVTARDLTSGELGVVIDQPAHTLTMADAKEMRGVASENAAGDQTLVDKIQSQQRN
jgi:molecular chaperone DnaK